MCNFLRVHTFIALAVHVYEVPMNPNRTAFVFCGPFHAMLGDYANNTLLRIKKR